jgi:hypothetical protein
MRATRRQIPARRRDWNGQKPQGFGFAFSPFAASSSIFAAMCAFGT